MMNIELARAIGCKSIMVPSEHGKEESKNSNVFPDYIAPDFQLAAKWIIERQAKATSGGER